MSLHAEMTLDGRLWTPGVWTVGTVKELVFDIAPDGRSWFEAEAVAAGHATGPNGEWGTIWEQVQP